MTGRELVISLQEILDEYRILEDTPLREIALIKVCDEVVLLNPVVEIHLINGSVFEISVTQIK